MIKDINQISMVDLLDSCIKDAEEEKAGKSTEKYNPLRPSSAGKCPKALWYALQEYRGLIESKGEPYSPETIRIFDYGHWTEEHIIRMFDKLYDPCKIKVKYKQQVVDTMVLEDGTIIEGSCDFALESDDGRVKILADAKSTKNAFNKAFKSRWDENIVKWGKMQSLKRISTTAFFAENALDLVDEFGDDFKTDNISQLNLYLGSKFFQDRGYQLGSLFYYVKNDSRIFELRFRFSQELKQRIIDKFNLIYTLTDESKLSGTYNLGSIRCAFCASKDRCWNTDALKAYFKTLPSRGEFPKDLYKIDNDELPKLFEEYENLLDNIENKAIIENKIIKILYNSNIDRVRLPNGNIYDLRLFKSPREHFELRKGKL